MSMILSKSRDQLTAFLLFSILWYVRTSAAQTGVLIATSFPGADIGARINNAIAALPASPDGLGTPCGTVIVPSSSSRYLFTTPIVKPRCVNLEGEGALSTVLYWNSSTGVALIAADGGSQSAYAAGQVADLTLEGISASNSTIAVYIGGNPSCGAGCTSDPSTNYGDHQNFNRVRISGFGTGVQWGNNAWSNGFDEDVITNNGTGVYFPNLYTNGNIPNSGESIVFSKTSIDNSTVGINQQGFSFFTFHGCRCDYNTLCGQVSFASFYGTHFEQSGGRFILVPPNTFQPTLIIDGGEMMSEASTGSDSDMVYVNSALNPTFILRGTLLFSNHSIAHVVNWNGTGGAAVLHIDALPYYQPGSEILALTNASCTFWGCHINDGQTGTAYEGGNLSVNGTLRKGGGAFTIDDPLDPANKLLSHSFVESPDMMNVYNGNITTDSKGTAVVRLPNYFEALNREFRYQLTVIGALSEASVAKEIDRNQFTIKTGRPHMKVSWQVTGIRRDPYAEAHRIPTEEMKPSQDRGRYLHPELNGEKGLPIR